jgi:hypothetical protein
VTEAARGSEFAHPILEIQMTSNNEPTVFVNFEIDRRDLFRANLELAKGRLLIGGVVVVAFGVALAYFFILIGEQKILLQTSPLFIGAPLVALGGPVLRLHAAARQYVSGLRSSQRQLTYTFTPSADGYNFTCGDSVSYVAWNDVKQIAEKPGYFLVSLDRFAVGVLPKRGFQSVDIPIFRSIVRSQLGERARVSAE